MKETEMFGRTLKVDVVRDKSANADADPGISFETKAAIAEKVAVRVIKKISYGVCMYVILDTARKIAVAAAEVKPD